MEEAGVRAQLAAILGRDIPDDIWELLVEDGYVQEVLGGVEDHKESLKRMERRARRYLRLISATPDSQRREFIPKKGSRLRNRMQAVSALLALEATKHPWVIRYRRDVLQDQLLDADKVEQWVLSQYQAQKGFTYWAVEVPLPTGALVLQDPRSGYFFTDPPLLVDKEFPTIRRVEVRRLSYTVPGDLNPRIVPVVADGVLGRLWRLSNKLEEIYGWTKTQGTMFVLTGHPPTIAPAWLMPDYRMPYQVTSRINLEIDPAVSPKEVAEFYRRARKEVISGRHRTLSEKHLQLARFLTARPEDESWAERLSAWNEAYPQWAYSADQVKNFSRNCMKARERLLHPDYRNPVAETAIENPWQTVEVKRRGQDDEETKAGTR